MADAISAATIAAVDRHLAHLGLYPRSDSAGLAPVAPPPPRRTGVVDPTTLLRPRTVLCCGPCSFTVHFRGPRPYSSAPPPTDGCCAPHHTPLRPRTVLCCGPCSLTVHFRGPRPCSSAPPDGRVLWAPPHTPPLPYSTLLRPLLPYSTLPRVSSL